MSEAPTLTAVSFDRLEQALKNIFAFMYSEELILKQQLSKEEKQVIEHCLSVICVDLFPFLRSMAGQEVNLLVLISEWEHLLTVYLDQSTFLLKIEDEAARSHIEELTPPLVKKYQHIILGALAGPQYLGYDPITAYLEKSFEGKDLGYTSPEK